MNPITFSEISTKPILPTSIIRVGVIPYCIKNNQIYWLMGKNKHGLISDFGGGCRSSRGETPLQCLFRETREEAGIKVYQLVKSSILNNNSSIFYKISSKKNKNVFTCMAIVEIPYIDVSSFKPNDEIVSIKWYKRKSIFSTKYSRIHDPIRHFLRLYKKISR